MDDQVAAVAEELPGLAGKTFSLAQYVVGDSMYIVADERDGSSVFFQQLGMAMYGPVEAQGDATGDARINVSTERSDLLQADLLAFLGQRRRRERPRRHPRLRPATERRRRAGLPGRRRAEHTVAAVDPVRAGAAPAVPGGGGVVTVHDDAAAV